MDQVKIVDAGDRLMVSGPSREVVEAAIEALVAKGVRVLAPPAQLGSRWVATCEKPSGGEDLDEPTLGDVHAVTDEALLKKVKISDAGEHLMVSGPEKNAVEGALVALARRGGHVLAPPAPLGNGWVATFVKAETLANQCSIERAGFQFIVRGRSRAAVEAKVADLAARGAKPIGSIEHVGGDWVAVCDAGEMTGIMHVR